MQSEQRGFFKLPAQALAGLAMFASPVFALDLEDHHLEVVPRTEAERARIEAVIAPTDDFTQSEKYELVPAGAATVFPRRVMDSFALPSGNMEGDRVLDFHLGDAMFGKLWVQAVASTRASDGLGPFYNARACQSCHIRDGRGHPPVDDDDDAVSFLLHISVPGDVPDEMAEIRDFIGTAPDPTYGRQLHDFAAYNMDAEFRLRVSYEEREVALSEGEVAHLRVPTYHAEDLAYGPLADDVMISPRAAPAMIGLGLLEAIPAEDILALADENDADGDGISGKPNYGWSVEYGEIMLGRFGLKAASPTVRQQSASAFSIDIGISTPLFTDLWGDCMEAVEKCFLVPHGDDDDARGGFEVDGEGLDITTFYSKNLGVPARRDIDDPQVLAGKEIFYNTGCIACHNPKFVTARLEDQPEQSFQLIWPYTDLLLHDMGEGLADHRPDGRATGREWRTPPLWGIGLSATVTGQSTYLHDGRARSLLEAVLWHGGEAEPARDAVIAMPKPDRNALIRFLESL
ncbi:MAG: thiol oxidoreductase [Rhodobacterales bacterium]|nr:MAG: thiol oxidoreductase [Rhodobacterales bacterium]